MTITFHCSQCNKKIEAQDSAAGKWAKCPVCHNKIYIPNLNADDEELKLAPIDESDEQRKKQLMDETFQLTQDILKEREIPEAGAGMGQQMPKINDKELTKNIIVYLRQMADGELDEAQKIANSIAPYGLQAIKILDKIAISDMPEPELADIPPQVLSGLIRNLRTRIS